jgi:UrcA family protein
MLKIVGTTLAAAALMAAAAHASPEVIRKDVQVTISDLNLATEAGARAAISRIEVAAKEACGGSPNFSPVYGVAPALARSEFNTCRSNAVSAAVKSLPFPMVQKVFASAASPWRLAAGN